MGTIAQEILRKNHGYEQRQSIKKDVDAAEAKAEGTEGKGKKEADTLDKKDADGKGKVMDDKRDLGDSSADAKATGEDPEKGKQL